MLRVLKNKLFFLIILGHFCHIPISVAGEQKCVILLHGLGRTHLSMSSLGSTLKKHNYLVVNRDYPSTKKSIDSISAQCIQPMIDECIIQHQSTQIVFITHSLGGIILEKYLESHEIPQLTHVVMLGPPNHGSPIVDKLQKAWFFRALLGPAGQALSSSKQGYTLSTKRAYRVGIIAGNIHLTPFSRWFFNEPNDGKVSVSSAYMHGADDFMVLPVTHTFMMNNALVQKNILSFLNFQAFRV